MPTALPKSNPRPAYFLPVTILILLAGTLFRVWDLAGVSLWSDENLSMLRRELSFMDMLDNIAVNGTQLPLYFIVVRIFPGDNQYLLRLPALLTAVLSIALFIMVIQRLYGRPHLALLAGALLAFNPYHIWLSRHARFYPQLFLLALLSSFLFLLLIHHRRSTLLWIGFALASAGTYLTHYFGALLPAAQFLYMFAVLRKQPRVLRQWFIVQGLAIAPAFAWFIYARSQSDTTYGIAWIPAPDASTLPTTIGNLTTGFTGTLEWYLLLALLMAAVGLLAGARHAIRRRQTQPVNLYWLLLLCVPLLLIYSYTVAYLDLSIYMDRYFMETLPGAIMLMLLGWYSLAESRSRVLLATGMLFLVFTSVGIIDILRHNEYEMYDFASVADFFEENQQPGDGLMFITHGAAGDFAQYSPLPNNHDDDTSNDSDQYFLIPRVKQEEDAERVDLLLARQAVEEGIELRRVWVFYRNPVINAHRTLEQPNWDPFEPSRNVEADSGTYDWLTTHQNDVIMHEYFNGIHVLLFEYDVRDYLNFPHPTP